MKLRNEIDSDQRQWYLLFCITSCFCKTYYLWGFLSDCVAIEIGRQNKQIKNIISRLKLLLLLLLTFYIFKSNSLTKKFKYHSVGISVRFQKLTLIDDIMSVVWKCHLMSNWVIVQRAVHKWRHEKKLDRTLYPHLSQNFHSYCFCMEVPHSVRPPSP